MVVATRAKLSQDTPAIGAGVGMARYEPTHVGGAQVRLYRSKIAAIATEIIAELVREDLIEVSHENTEEAEKDLVAIMEEYDRRDNDFRNGVRDNMAARSIPYDQYGKVRSRLAEEQQHPTGDDVERFLARQFVENMMITQFVEEIWAEDKELYKRCLEVLRRHHVDERAIRDEAVTKVKNVKEGTVDFEIALQQAVKEVKKRRGLV